MSREAVEAVIGKAVLDAEFREALWANPDEALASWDLTEDEIAGFKELSAESVDAMAGNLDERVSKAWGIPMAGGLFDWQALQALIFHGRYPPGTP